jgi:hypothetical protein
VLTTPNGAPIDQVNFYARKWVPVLEEPEIRLRPFYNVRHTYITYLSPSTPYRSSSTCSSASSRRAVI